MAELTDSDLDALTLAAEADITRVEPSILADLVTEVRQHRAGRKIDVHVLDVKPHPDQATTHPGTWAVQYRADHAGHTHTFWRWYSVRETNKNGAYITPSNKKKPEAEEILADFWHGTFLELHGFDFQEHCHPTR